jgi:hypothetical protein
VTQAHDRSARARDALERVYAAEIRPHRLALEQVREQALDPTTEHAAACAAAAVHRRAARAAWRAADECGGLWWTVRVGIPVVDLLDALWRVHGEPLTGLTAERLRDVQRDVPPDAESDGPAP